MGHGEAGTRDRGPNMLCLRSDPMILQAARRSMSGGSTARKSLRIPVSVVLERRIARVGPWSQVQWEAVAAVAGEAVVSERGKATLVHEDDESRRYLWPGLAVELFPDGCESYWYNLLSDRPSLFVVCFEGDEDEEGEAELIPAIVTASQDEANAHLESDDPVYSVPMPEKIVEWVERYVVENYQPEVKKKRKREDWTRESENTARERKGSQRLH